MSTTHELIPGGFTASEWEAAVTWSTYAASIDDKREVWDANFRRADVDEEVTARLHDLPGKRRVLVLTEDWCGDAARSVPAIAKALLDAPDVEARYLASDEHPRVVRRYLTHGGQAIPIAIVQDEHGRELGAWGPRPAPLQAIMRQQKRAIGAATAEIMAKWYAPILGWYGKDKGRTTLEELLMLLERGGDPR